MRCSNPKGRGALGAISALLALAVHARTPAGSRLELRPKRHRRMRESKSDRLLARTMRTLIRARILLVNAGVVDEGIAVVGVAAQAVPVAGQAGHGPGGARERQLHRPAFARVDASDVVRFRRVARAVDRPQPGQRSRRPRALVHVRRKRAAAGKGAESRAVSPSSASTAEPRPRSCTRCCRSAVCICSTRSKGSTPAIFRTRRRAPPQSPSSPIRRSMRCRASSAIRR